MDDVARLAELLKSRNAIDRDIAALIGRPAQIDHIGKYIAAAVFDITLQPSSRAIQVTHCHNSLARPEAIEQLVELRWH